MPWKSLLPFVSKTVLSSATLLECEGDAVGVEHPAKIGNPKRNEFRFGLCHRGFLPRAATFVHLERIFFFRL
jgi:hypothetical protein